MNFNDLNENDRKQLLKFPAYITLLAVNPQTHLDRRQKKEAARFSHIKTFSCDPLLRDFYKAADSEFLQNIEDIDGNLHTNVEEREQVIKEKLSELEELLGKMDTDFALVFHKSMRQFKDHVSKAYRNILEYFLFPLPLEGISD